MPICNFRNAFSPTMSIKKIAYALSGLLLLAVLVPLSLLTVFQDTLTQTILGKVNQAIAGQIVAEKIEIAPFRHFPYISLMAQNVSFGHKASEDTGHIYYFEEVYIGFDVLKLLQNDYTIKKIWLKKGAISLIKDTEGNINLLTAKQGTEQEPTEPQSEQEALHLALEQIILEEVDFIKDDHLNDQFIDLFIKKGVMDFRMRDQFYDVHTEADLLIKSLRLQEQQFFKNRELHFSLDTEADLETGLITILPSTMSIHSGEVGISGTINLKEDAYVDLELTGKKDNFEFLISLASEELYQQFSSYQHEGKIFFQGRVYGKAGNGHSPQIEIEFGCENANFVNPGAKSLRDLNFRGFFTNGARQDLTTSELFIENLSGKPEQSMFFGRFHLVNFAEPRLFADFHSKLDLADLAGFMQIDGLEEATGQLQIDFVLDQLDDNLKTQEDMLAKLKAGSNSRIMFQNMRLRLKGMPYPLGGLNGRVDLNEGKITIDSLSGLIGKTDLKMSGSISNILPLFLSKPDSQLVEVRLKARSENFDVRELLSYDPAYASLDEAATGLVMDVSFKARATDLLRFELIPEGVLNVHQFSAALKHYTLPFRQVSGQVLMEKQRIVLNNVKGHLGEHPFSLSGWARNWASFLSDTAANIHQPAEVALTLNAPTLPLKPLLTYKETCYLPESAPVAELTQVSGTVRLLAAPAELLRTDGKMPAMQVTFDNVAFNAEGYPAASQVTGILRTDPDNLHFKDLHAKLGLSDLTLTGSIQHFWDSLPERYLLSISADLLDLNNLLPPSEAPAEATASAAPSTPENPFEAPFPTAHLHLEAKKVLFRKKVFENLLAQVAVTPNHRVTIEQFHTDFSGGQIDLHGYFNGADPKNIYFNSTLKIKQLDIQKAFHKFDNFGQDFLIEDNISGILQANIRSNILIFPDLTADMNRSTATIEATVTDGVLLRFAPFQAMARFTGDRDLDRVRFSEMKNTFELKNGTIHIPKMSINSTLGYFLIEGTKTVDQVMDFEIQVPMKLVRKAAWNFMFNKKMDEAGVKESDEEVVTKESLENRRYLYLTVKGTPDKFDMKMGRRKK